MPFNALLASKVHRRRDGLRARISLPLSALRS
jgi:hypothetical protein